MNTETINLHFLTLPHTILSKTLPGAIHHSFAQIVINLKKGLWNYPEYVIRQYGHEDCDRNFCHEHITVTTNDDFKKSGYLDHSWESEDIQHYFTDLTYLAFHENAIRELRKRVDDDEHHLVLTIGSGHRMMLEDLHDLKVLVVDPAMCHYNGYADYNVYNTYSHMHQTYGESEQGYRDYFQAKEILDELRKRDVRIVDNKKGIVTDWSEFLKELETKIPGGTYAPKNKSSVYTPRFADNVIYLPTDFEDFDYLPTDEKDDYYLFLGRCFYGKGFEIAIKVAQELGKRLIIAGPQNGDRDLDNLGYDLPSNVEYFGKAANLEERRELMSKAELGFAPTLITEPAGLIIGEYGASGTPVITTDWGGFTEYVEDEKTGFRCRFFEDFVEKSEQAKTISSEYCYERALRLHSIENIARQYHEYFQKLVRFRKSGNKQESWYVHNIPDTYWFLDRNLSELGGNMQYSDIEVLLAESGSDKTTRHKYGSIYNDVFNALAMKQGRKLDICEIGVSRFNPGSFGAWQKSSLFGQVLGIDVQDYEGSLRVGSLFWKVDAYLESTVDYLEENGYVFDIIIDDGSHDPADQEFFLNNYDRLLSSNGILICEDVYDLDLIVSQSKDSNVSVIDGWANHGHEVKNYGDKNHYHHDERLIIKRPDIQKKNEIPYLKTEAKPHIVQLPFLKLPAENYDRSSKELAVSIPLFHSNYGSFDIDRFKEVHVKGAIWAGLSLLYNSDLGERGTSLYFHVEDKVYSDAKKVFDICGIPEDWIRQVSLPEMELNHKINRHPMGKKYIGLLDDTVDADVFLILDSDAFTLSEGEPIRLYDDMTSHLLKVQPSMTYFKLTDKPYWWWVYVYLLAAGFPNEWINSETPLNKLELMAYRELGFEKEIDENHQRDTRVLRYWGENQMVTFPKNHSIRSYTIDNILRCHCSPYIHCIWSHFNQPFLELNTLLNLPVYFWRDEFRDGRRGYNCLAHIDQPHEGPEIPLDAYYDVFFEKLTTNLKGYF